MFRKCEGFNTYEETLNSLNNKKSQLEELTGYKANIYPEWTEKLHELFEELALNRELTEVEIVSTRGVLMEMAPRIDASVGNFYISLIDHKEKVIYDFVSKDNEINYEYWQTYKDLAPKSLEEMYEVE